MIKSHTIILLGDFICDLQGIENKTDHELQLQTTEVAIEFVSAVLRMQNIVS